MFVTLAFSSPFLCNYAVFSTLCNLSPNARALYYTEQKSGSLMAICSTMAWAEKLVRHLHSQGVPIAVATGSSEKKYDLKITHHKELFSLFSHVVFASDDPEVRQGKPCPDVFTVCAKRFPSPSLQVPPMFWYFKMHLTV
ncbi:hypothetical protein EB796_007753 [Bugula neritina]|uniref:HDHD1 n=1 Tax=Bugula neritina TaxID=10212 RepID=A0A7J7K7K9_BUGNE|nr:hypothetical protein EB796_007753 [Bugula neritina]